MRATTTLFLPLSGLLLLSGCGEPTMAPVKGRVTCQGKPVSEAAITFSPVPRTEGDKEPGKSATGYSDADGVYVLSTYKQLDGAHVGKHRVTITLEDTNRAPCKRSTQVVLDVKPGDNALDIELTK
jgi:hypothetical protein